VAGEQGLRTAQQGTVEDGRWGSGRGWRCNMLDGVIVRTGFSEEGFVLQRPF
jgi:hypothetical protein